MFSVTVDGIWNKPPNRAIHSHLARNTGRCGDGVEKMKLAKEKTMESAGSMPEILVLTSAIVPHRDVWADGLASLITNLFNGTPWRQRPWRQLCTANTLVIVLTATEISNCALEGGFSVPEAPIHDESHIGCHAGDGEIL